jgi:hypothetical protein
MSKGSISKKKKIRRLKKGIRKNEKVFTTTYEEEDIMQFVLEDDGNTF